MHMKKVSADEPISPACYISALKKMDAEFAKKSSPRFAQIFRTNEDMQIFLNKLQLSLSSNTLDDKFRKEIVDIYDKHMRQIISDPIYRGLDDHTPTQGEMSLFLSDQKVDEFTFLRVVRFGLFNFFLGAKSATGKT